MEALFKVRYWDYSNQRFNFQGHICLSSSIAWGFLTILMTRVVHRPVEQFVMSIPGNVLFPKCIKGYFRRKRYECLFGNKRGYRTRVSVLDFSRCNRAETGTPARTTFTFFLFWSVILPARHPMSVLCREVCKQSLWGVLSRLVHCTLLPNTPNAHTGPERAFRA